MTAETAIIILIVLVLVMAGVIIWLIMVRQPAVIRYQVAQQIDPLKTALENVTTANRTAVASIESTSGWVEQYKHVLSNNVKLNALVSKLQSDIEVLNGQVYHLNGLDQRLVSLTGSQSAQLERQARTINEQVALIERLTGAPNLEEVCRVIGQLLPLVDQLTRALEGRGTKAE